MNVPFLDLTRYLPGEKERLSLAAERVLSRGRFVLGPEVEAFEQEFAAFVGAAYAVGVANGTDAITLGLTALGIGAGDEVLTVSMTCAPTATGILRAGATPVFVDVSDEDLTMDPALLEEALTEATRAIVPVHLYGRPAAMEELRSFASAHGLALFEDCAQAHGTRLAGRGAGTFGNAASWSFYPTKNLGAIGDGGAVTTDDPEIAARLKRLRLYGYATRNDSQELGWNSRLDELQAAFLRERLALLPQANARRAAIAARYDAELASVVRTPRKPAEDQLDAHHLYVVRVPDRDAFRARLAERGVGTDVHYPRAVHEQHAFASLPGLSLPVTEAASSEVVSLPCYPMLRDDEVDAAISAVLA